MAPKTICKIASMLLIMGVLSGCGVLRPASNSASAETENYPRPSINGANDVDTNPENTIWSILNRKQVDNSVSVNKYLWSASLEVLSFLPVQSVDPFTGVIVTGYGTPPGGGRSYRATVLVDDPALDARSLNVALQTRGGRAVSRATARAVEDAILSRAREMRISDNRF